MAKEQVEDVDNLLEQIKYDLDKTAINIRSNHNRKQKDIQVLETNYIRAFQQGLWNQPLTEMGTVIRNELKKRGIRDSQLGSLASFLQEEHRNPSQRRSSLPSDEEFEQMQESVFDQTEEMSQRVLSDKQLDKLSDAEGIEVVSNEISWRKSRKTIDNDRIKHLQEYAMKRGWKLVDKVTKELPPEFFWGQSAAYFKLEELERQHDILHNMCKDLKQQVYHFKPTPQTDKKAVEELSEYVNKEFIPYSKIAIEHCEGVKTIMRNITDEKYSNTNRAWMQNAEDKFLSFGNHGSGEVNAVLSNIVVLKLGFEDKKDEDGNVIKSIPVIVKTWVKRETTREEEGDKTIVEFTDKTNQMFIECPECKLEFNKPIVTDEQRDLIAGDLFHQAKTTLIHNGLSNAIDALANNIVTEYVQDPIEWFKKEWKRKYKRDPTAQELKDVKIKEDQEKIKDVDIDPKDITEKRHSMIGNIATRRMKKAQHFSDNS